MNKLPDDTANTFSFEYMAGKIRVMTTKLRIQFLNFHRHWVLLVFKFKASYAKPSGDRQLDGCFMHTDMLS